MFGYWVLGLCHVLIFLLVRWYMRSDLIRRGGDHSFISLFVLWIIVLPLMTLSTAFAIDLTGSYEASERFTVGGISVLMALTWGVPMIWFTTETLSTGTVDKMMGLTREIVDAADLSKARELMLKDDRQGAIAELHRQRAMYPDAPSPKFMLAAFAYDDDDYEQAADYFREILQRCGNDDTAWMNAAQSLADLLRDRLDDPGAANHLEAEIRTRNPDVVYKMSKTAERKKIEQRYKKKRQGPTRPKRKNRKGQDELIDLNQARRLVQREHVAEAADLFKRYLHEHPGEVKVHFELVTLYERNGQAEDAVARLQKLIHDFGEDDDVWGNAMLRLATVREVHQGDRAVSKSLLESVASRLKHARHGIDARQRLKDMQERDQTDSGGI